MAKKYIYCPNCGSTKLEHRVLTTGTWYYGLDGDQDGINEGIDPGSPDLTAEASCVGCGHDDSCHAFQHDLPYTVVTEGLDDGRYAITQWKPEYNAAACAEGWAFFDDNAIHRYDDATLFDSDDDAIEHVRKLAAAGSALHAIAIKLHDGVDVQV